MSRFTNISISSEHMNTQAHGGAEGIFASVKPVMRGDMVSYLQFFTWSGARMTFSQYNSDNAQENLLRTWIPKYVLALMAAGNREDASRWQNLCALSLSTSMPGPQSSMAYDDPL